MAAAVRCPESLNAMLLPELAAAPMNRATASTTVACSTGNPKSSVASEPGEKKSMIRPMTHGMARFTPVERTRHDMPTVRRRHWGFAREMSLMIDAVSGTVCAAAGGEAAGAEVMGGASIDVDGDGGEEVAVGIGGVGESGLTDSGFADEELKRICRKARRRSTGNPTLDMHGDRCRV